jgi:hypothetical protein
LRRVLMPLLVVPLVATACGVSATAAPGAPVPHNAAWVSSARLGTWRDGTFDVFNNMWNKSAGPQTIWAYSYGNWGVRSTQAAGNTAVETYPSVQQNFGDRPLRDFRGLRNGFTARLPSPATSLDAEWADDIWLNHYHIEVMIWVNNQGQTPAGSVVARARIFGQDFAVWHGGTDWTFQLGHNETSGVTHMLASLRWLMNHGDIPRSARLTQVDFGVEVASTGGVPRDFTVTRYWLQS